MQNKNPNNNAGFMVNPTAETLLTLASIYFLLAGLTRFFLLNDGKIGLLEEFCYAGSSFFFGKTMARDPTLKPLFLALSMIFLSGALHLEYGPTLNL